ncbi:MAG: hypothetical protein ACOCG4_08565, partial [Methanoculleus sp.]
MERLAAYTIATRTPPLDACTASGHNNKTHPSPAPILSPGENTGLSPATLYRQLPGEGLDAFIAAFQKTAARDPFGTAF